MIVGNCYVPFLLFGAVWKHDAFRMHVIISSQVRDVWIAMGFLPQTFVLWESFNLLLAKGGSSPFTMVNHS